jgi:hypothetical protein
MAEALLGNISLTLLKEVYLLTRFVVRTARTGLHHDTERSKLLEQLDFEHLFVKTFAVMIFERNGVIINHPEINRQWLIKIEGVLETYRDALADYSKLAAERDSAYKKFSPYRLEQAPEQAHLDFQEFDWQIQTDEVTDSLEIIPLGENSDAAAIAQPSKQKTTKIPSFDWRFALFDKRRLEKILSKSQECREHLTNIIQLTMAFNSIPLTPSSSRLNNGNAAVLGLTPHARLLQLNQDITIEDVTPVNLRDHHYELDLPDQADWLALGHIRKTDEFDITELYSDVLVEKKKVEGVSEQIIKENVQRILKLAQSLSASNAELGTLPLRGYWPSDDNIAFVFDFPQHVIAASPISLYDLISRGLHLNPGLSLPHRFHVANRIARALAAFHADKWVHKSFRSRSIVFFKHLENASVDYKNPYLVNFEYARAVDTKTTWDSDADVERNLYRHPDRQSTPRKSFNAIHDLYALGVVLLEIGLWQPIVKVKSYIEATLPIDTVLDPDLLAEKLLEKAVRDLPHLMGPSYAKAVEVCLRGSFGVGVVDPGFSLAVQNRVVEKVSIKHLNLAT